MKAQLTLGRPFGIAIGLHFSWFLIALLIVLSLSGRFREVHPQWGAGVVWATAAATAALFFATLVLHELSHAIVARSRGIPVRTITLFALGGVAEMDRDSKDPATEFWVGIAGPAASLGIGGLCLGAARLLGWVPMSEPEAPLVATLVWLGYINFTLALFNLIPAFPLDGGRILRAVLWRLRDNVLWATRWSARVGQVWALGLMVLGFIRLLIGDGFGGLWIMFIGWFLWIAAATTYGQVEVAETLRGIRVGDVMHRGCPTVDGRTNLKDFVEQQLLRTGSRCFAVTERSAIAGVVTVHEVKAVPRPRWPYTTVDEIMQPLETLHAVSPASTLNESVEIMGRDHVQQLPVLDGGRILGVISRGAILRLLRTRAELRA